jgi:hypothetical protein
MRHFVVIHQVQFKIPFTIFISEKHIKASKRFEVHNLLLKSVPRLFTTKSTKA